MQILDRHQLRELMQKEVHRFEQEHPKSNDLYQRARQSMQGGVPMLWMIRWPGAFPVFVKNAKGAHFEDVDGHSYIDFCLGDTGAMTGHSPEKSIEAIRSQVGNGITMMLPTDDAIWVGEELQRRFGLKFWQFTLTASDANRFAIRMARHITGRSKILVFNYCYHGSVDETRVVEFNDIQALEDALRHEDVAAVLAEPVMTNIGIIHPQPGFHAALRELTIKYGSYLIIDETHTICTSPGGYTGKFDLRPDFLTCGKPLASGIPVGVYGFTQNVARAFWSRIDHDQSDVGGIGGTLAGNALSIAAIRATLENVLTQPMYDRCEFLANRYEQGILDCITEFNLPWIVKRLGFRVEYWFCEKEPVNGGEANSAVDSDLDRFMHLWALNRGILMTPFHNMALIAADTSEEDIDHHTRVFREAVQALFENQDR
jgi:glutamate-1-semialdehyde 2,1-aminomutase